MWVQATNLARVCTAKWQPLYAVVEKAGEPRPQLCQIFLSPYNWDHAYFYNNEWHAVDGNTIKVYEWANWRNYNSETDWQAIQYSNKQSITRPEEPVITNYTVTVEVNNADYWTVDTSEVTVASWTAVSAEANVLTIWTNTITATAAEGYVFSSWGTLPETVTEDLTITATFTADL